MEKAEEKIEGYVPKTFKDEGTGETFEGEKTHKFSPGAHANYKHAGLIGEEPKQEATTAAPKKG